MTEKTRGEQKASLPLSDAQSTLRATLARGVAAAVVGGFDEAAEEGRPLNQRQQMFMVRMAVMAYHDAVVEGEEALEAGALIATMFVPTTGKEAIREYDQD